MDDELARALADAVGADSVVELERLSGGASRETWAFDAVVDGGRRPLILQRRRVVEPIEPGGGEPSAEEAAAEEAAVRLMATEAGALRAAAGAGVPVPAVVAWGDGGVDSALGAPFLVAERLTGETIPRRILRDGALADARAGLAAQCGAALAAVHAIDPADVDGLADEDHLVRYREVLDELGEPHPAFELAFRWLTEHRPPPTERTVVHGDFRLGNLLVGPRGLMAVLDWELVHVGEPLEDLAWLCVRAWRFGEAPAVGGFGNVDDLVGAYEAASGTTVDRRALDWHVVLGTLKWGIMCITQAEVHRSGTARSVELAAIGRRVCEQEHDVLDLVAPGPWPSPATAPGSTGHAPHDVPTAVELLEAVGELLVGDVMGATEGRVRFHARVAANVVATVAREIALGPAQAAAHAERLSALGVADEAALADGIRRGTLDERGHDVVAAVRATVADKLAVANPPYGSGP